MQGAKEFLIRKNKHLFLWAIFATFLLLFSSCLSAETKQLRQDLDERGVISTGVIYDKKYVIRTDNIFFYEFKVDSSKYTGHFSGYVLWKLDVGDSIEIRYDPLNPARNERVKAPVEAEKLSHLFWIIAIPIMIAGFYLKWYLRTRD